MTDKEYIEKLEGRIKKMEDFWNCTVRTRVVPSAQSLFDKDLWGALCIVPSSEYSRMMQQAQPPQEG